MTATPWKDALCDHRFALTVSAVYAAAVLAEAFYCRVPPSNLMHIFGYIFMSVMIFITFAAGMYIFAFLQFFMAGEKTGGFLRRWKTASGQLDIVTRSYLEGRRWAYACMAFLAMSADNFFFVSKSLINTVNPYVQAGWDPVFAAWDKALHFGFYPHEWIIPATNMIGAGRVLDAAYALWLLVMFFVTGYTIFVETSLYRRLRFLWTYLLSWIVLGTIGATVFSTVGPLFYHDFYPALPDIYAPIVQNMDALSNTGFLFAAKTRQLLLGWAHNDRIFDPNALSAMPSMHLAVSWIMVMYARSLGRGPFMLALPFFVMMYLGSIYLGFHYAVDAYVSVAVTSLIWWVSGKMLARHRGRSLEDAA